jgi:hypothetical protein
MSATQLAIRFNQRQIETLDALATERHTTRSGVIKDLVDKAEKSRISALYAAAYDGHGPGNVDDFGDLEAFHDAAEQDRIAARAGEKTW